MSPPASFWAMGFWILVSVAGFFKALIKYCHSYKPLGVVQSPTFPPSAVGNLSQYDMQRRFGTKAMLCPLTNQAKCGLGSKVSTSSSEMRAHSAGPRRAPWGQESSSDHSWYYLSKSFFPSSIPPVLFSFSLFLNLSKLSSWNSFFLPQFSMHPLEWGHFGAGKNIQGCHVSEEGT